MLPLSHTLLSTLCLYTVIEFELHANNKKKIKKNFNRGVWVIHSDRGTSRCFDLVESCMIRNHRGSSTCAIYIYDVACVLHALDVLSFSIQKGTTCKVKPQNLGVTWGVWDSMEQLFHSYPLKDPKDASAPRQGSKIQLRTAPHCQHKGTSPNAHQAKF